MASFLEEVTAARRADAERRRGEGALEEAQKAAQAARPPRDFRGALAKPGMSLIAEIKRASPSAGPIAPDADPLALARAYRTGGASAISVLTEPEHFRGSLEDLRDVRAGVELPVLRKDFIADPLQVWEARAAGADAVLLIVAALRQDELVALGDLADSLGMIALVETHDDAEIARALEADAHIIGINTRNLATLEVDPGMVAKLRDDIPADITVVGESGVSARADVAAMEAIGVDAVLVGEALMRAPDPAAKIRELLGG
ncbi:MAG: indole-3-glycerol phosphate synthase TrpC [Actinomycetota bacterium]